VAFFFEDAPGASATSKSDESVLSLAHVDDFVSSSEGLRLIAAFSRIKAKCLDTWFAAHPEITVDGPLDHFAMHAVRCLVNAFVFNDRFGTDNPDFRERLQQLLDKMEASRDSSIGS
jgi:hypothetical protein